MQAGTWWGAHSHNASENRGNTWNYDQFALMVTRPLQNHSWSVSIGTVRLRLKGALIFEDDINIFLINTKIIQSFSIDEIKNP